MKSGLQIAGPVGHDSRMAKTPKRSRDPNQLAHSIIGMATGDNTTSQVRSESARPAVEFARQGGLRGGRARAEKLSSEERTDIARRAAAARWKRDGHN